MDLVDHTGSIAGVVAVDLVCQLKGDSNHHCPKQAESGLAGLEKELAHPIEDQEDH